MSLDSRVSKRRSDLGMLNGLSMAARKVVKRANVRSAREMNRQLSELELQAYYMEIREREMAAKARYDDELLFALEEHADCVNELTTGLLT
jgi:hypothetical protein